MKNIKVRIVGICGSLRKNGYTRAALRVALEGAREIGAEVKFIDPGDYDLVFCGQEEEGETIHKGVKRLREEVSVAEGIILATPEYHGGYSGVLKNTLDLMGFEEFQGKMIGLIGVSGGRYGAFNALSGLRNVGRTLRAWVIPDQVVVPRGWEVFSETGEVLDEEIGDRLRELGRQVARFACLHSSDRAMEFVREWESAQENPGGAQ